MTLNPSLNDDVTSTEVVFRPLAFANATATFVLFGATSSLFGPLLISFSRRFDLSLPTAGTVLSVFFVGALLGVPIGWLGVKRFRGNVVLSATMLLMALGAAGASLSKDWAAFLLSVFVIGLAFGGVDFSLNTLLVRIAMRQRAHRLSLANAGYGVGSVIGPVLIILIRPHNFPLLFAGLGGFAVFLSLFNRGIEAPPLHHALRRVELATMKSQRRPILITFIVAYILYVAAESSSAGWIAPQLHRVGYSQSIGSLVTASFWGGLAIGRVVGGPLCRRLSDRILVLGGLGLAFVLCVGAFSNSLAPYAYPLLGLVIASVYPMGLIWYTVLCPHDSDGLALLIFFMMAGGVIGPGAESLMVALLGIHVVPLVIGAFVLLDLAVFASALRFRPLRAL